MKKFFTLIIMLTAALGMQAQDTWTVAGAKAMLGTNWDPTDTNNDMTSTDGTNFTLVKTGVMLAAGDYEYKVLKNHAWDESYGVGGENAKLTVDADGEYTITFTFSTATTEVGATAVKTGDYVAPVVGDQTWTVAGVEPLCGSNWNPADESNDMTSTDGVNYTLVKEGCQFEKGVSYGFKVVADHAWGEEYPSDNYDLTVTENGIYTVTITFNKDTKEVNATATKTADWTPSTKVWTIAGASALMGTNWDQTDTNNDMMDTGDGVTFALVKEHVALLADTEYEFKVLANHSWTENYGKDGKAGGDNVILTVEKDATYTVTFVFNTESKELFATAEEEDPTAIQAVKSTVASDGVMYNLQGQRVQAGFRGIAIQNGRKVVMK